MILIEDGKKNNEQKEGWGKEEESFPERDQDYFRREGEKIKSSEENIDNMWGEKKGKKHNEGIKTEEAR